MIWSFLVKYPLLVVAAQQIYCNCLLDCVAPRCVCICLNLISPEFPRVHSHHSHQSHLADQDSSAAGNQVRSLDPLGAAWSVFTGAIMEMLLLAGTVGSGEWTRSSVCAVCTTWMDYGVFTEACRPRTLASLRLLSILSSMKASNVNCWSSRPTPAWTKMRNPLKTLQTL